MTTQEIIRLARRKLLETTTDVLPDDVLLIYVNQAYADVKKRTFSNSDIKSATVALSNGTGTLPVTFGTMYGDAVDTSGNFFPEQNIADFERAELERAVKVEGGNLVARPASTASLTVRYWERPETLTNSVNPSNDPFFHEPIVYGALWRAHEDLQDEELATYYKQRFLTEIQERTGVQSNYEEDNQRGGVMFNYQSLI
jgi:hypothetical protein